jgi:hypothetical protein
MTNSKPKPKQALGQVEGGIMGVGVQKETPKKIKKETPAKNVETVAIYSSRNLHWDGVGNLVRGYNIVPESKAEMWLANKNTRLATPEEVAGAYRN